MIGAACLPTCSKINLIRHYYNQAVLNLVINILSRISHLTVNQAKLGNQHFVPNSPLTVNIANQNSMDQTTVDLAEIFSNLLSPGHVIRVGSYFFIEALLLQITTTVINCNEILIDIVCEWSAFV